MIFRSSTAARLTIALALTGLLPQLEAQFNGPATSLAPVTSPAPPPTTDRRLLFPTSPDVHFAPGDLLQVHLFEQPDFEPTVRVDATGVVLLPMIGSVQVGGLGVTDAEHLIAARLQDGGFYRDPQVNVRLLEGPGAVATVSGEAHGVVPIVGSRRLLDVLSAAGGLPATASHVVTVQRPGADKPLIIDLGSDPLKSDAANVPIFPGDTIITSRIGLVYVVGAFKNQGAIPLTQYTPLTLTQATALSGGLGFEGKYEDLHLIRTVGDKRTVVKLDIKRILYGKDPDPILQPNDILFLPNSTLKASIGNGSLPTLLGIASLLISVVRY